MAVDLLNASEVDSAEALDVHLNPVLVEASETDSAQALNFHHPVLVAATEEDTAGTMFAWSLGLGGANDIKRRKPIRQPEVECVP